MAGKSGIRNGYSRRATVLTMGVIFGTLVGVGVMALAIDTGMMYSARQELQNAADSAALAAASQLGSPKNAEDLAAAQATALAAANRVYGTDARVDVNSDVIFGHAVLNGDKYEFLPGEAPFDAVKITIRRDQTAADGPVSLLFAKTFGMSGANLRAHAVAMLVPRDIALVIDLSGSMNDDSELRHYRNFPSETGGTRPGVQVNTEAIWAALPVSKGVNGIKNGANPTAPVSPPTGASAQPGNGSGTPAAANGTGNSTTGPRWGWMTKFGSAVTLGSYSVTSDTGLWYIPKSSTCSDADVTANLTENTYASAERTALLAGASDSTSGQYTNRVKVLLGLVAWKSGKSGGKFTGSGLGNGDNVVATSELTQAVAWPFTTGSWDEYISYVSSSSTWMYQTDSNFRYRYGIKTLVNYLLESHAGHPNMPELAACPEQPVKSVKNAVQAMIDEIVSLDSNDQVSLETFQQYGYHTHNLIGPDDGATPAAALGVIPTALNGMQAAHFTSITNIGGGLQKGIQELTSVRARSASSKVIIMLTDGKPNTNSAGSSIGDNNPVAIAWSLDQAKEAKDQGMIIYTVGVGGDVNESLCREISTYKTDQNGHPVYAADGMVATDNYFFADNTPDPANHGQPKYVAELNNIFKALGGRRQVRLIQ